MGASPLVNLTHHGAVTGSCHELSLHGPGGAKAGVLVDCGLFQGDEAVCRDIPEIADLQEVETMLSERVIEWTKEWKEQGLEQGLEQGRQEGRLEGEIALLQRMLTRRFGPLDDATRAPLAAASTDQLEDRALRVLDAASLDDVFAQ